MLPKVNMKPGTNLSRRSSFLCNWRQIDFYNDIGHVWLTVLRYRAENIYAISMKRIGGFNFLINLLALREELKTEKKYT